MNTLDTTPPISATIKLPAGSTMRLVAVLADFKARYGQWPVAVDIDAGMLEGLKTQMLTPLGYARLCERLKVSSRVKGEVVARGPKGSRLRVSSGTCRHTGEVTPAEVAEWLGWDDPTSKEIADDYFKRLLG